MLGKANILVVEENAFVALEFADQIEAAGGVVIGPVASVTEALSIIDTVAIDAAILDGDLADRDVTPIALRLRELDIPAIVCSGTGLPPELAQQRPDTLLFLKPTSVSKIVTYLAGLIINK